jgi:hypothetical protein
VPEEELELEGSLLAVVAASVLMEWAASALGSRFVVPEIVVGALVLAAVTSLPNAVAASGWLPAAAAPRPEHLLEQQRAQHQHRPAAPPAAVIGLGRPDGQTTLIAAWYFGAHRRSAGVRLPRPRDTPGERHRGHRRLPPVRRVPARVWPARGLPQPQMAIAAGLTAAAFAALLVPGAAIHATLRPGWHAGWHPVQVT